MRKRKHSRKEVGKTKARITRDNDKALTRSSVKRKTSKISNIKNSSSSSDKTKPRKRRKTKNNKRKNRILEGAQKTFAVAKDILQKREKSKLRKKESKSEVSRGVERKVAQRVIRATSYRNKEVANLHGRSIHASLFEALHTKVPSIAKVTTKNKSNGTKQKNHALTSLSIKYINSVGEEKKHIYFIKLPKKGTRKSTKSFDIDSVFLSITDDIDAQRKGEIYTSLLQKLLTNGLKKDIALKHYHSEQFCAVTFLSLLDDHILSNYNNCKVTDIAFDVHTYKGPCDICVDSLNGLTDILKRKFKQGSHQPKVITRVSFTEDYERGYATELVNSITGDDVSDDSRNIAVFRINKEIINSLKHTPTKAKVDFLTRRDHVATSRSGSKGNIGRRLSVIPESLSPLKPQVKREMRDDVLTDGEIENKERRSNIAFGKNLALILKQETSPELGLNINRNVGMSSKILQERENLSRHISR